MDLRCRFCQRQFEPSRFHPEQTASSLPPCQQQRRNQSRKQKLARDAEYRQTCRDSARQWRANHPGYWKRYRSSKPESAARNRTRPQQRDLRQRLARLANNHLAPDLKSSVARVWWPAGYAACKQPLGYGPSLYPARRYPPAAPPASALQTTSLWCAGRACLILQT
jgi:hypothetical protein